MVEASTSPEVADVVDVLIVGGGPIGLATAIAARRAGLSVAVIDRGRPPIDGACGEGLMPDAVDLLSRLGVDLNLMGGFKFRGIRYLEDDLVVEGTFPDRPGRAVHRADFHASLVARAEEVGVDLRWATPARGLALEGPTALGVETDAGLVRGRFVVGADGLRSKVRHWAGLEEASPAPLRFGMRRHFEAEPWCDFVEVYWGPGCEAYVYGLGPHEMGVALLWSGEKANFDQLLERFPAVAARLRDAPATSRDLGAGPLDRRVTSVCRGNVALVGDASGYRDAITGEGIAKGLHQALALVESLSRGNLSRYPAAHRRASRLPDAMTAITMAFERHPRLRRRALVALAKDPAMFSRLLGIHARALPVRSLGLGGAGRLAWRFVAG
ncbi:MAG TPA: NAD(P)/FAD-dependent oxidoreductase [Thermoanaerobaculia bacterium]|nr:NAD(P)/FAD-dependent oxidoreductase [Thermoanaerobaculia bacterium]